MSAVKVLRVSVALFVMLVAGPSHADDPAVKGTYVGHGGQCHGQLRATDKTVEWHTPFARCTKRAYVVIDRDPLAAPSRVALLLKGRACDFGVITRHVEPACPDYWIAKGYRNRRDYERDSADTLGCSVARIAD